MMTKKDVDILCDQALAGIADGCCEGGYAKSEERVEEMRKEFKRMLE